MKIPVAELVASTAFALFIMCPRMAGMCAVLAKLKSLNPYVVAVLGAVMAIPLIVLMVYLTLKFGVHIAIIAAVITDIMAALAMGAFTWRHAIEVMVIALFVWLGVFVAKWITSIAFSQGA